METVTYACGHETDGSRRVSKKQLAQPCFECFKLGQITEADQALPVLERHFGPLPALVGSQAQCAWAHSIRAEALAGVMDVEISIEARIGALYDGLDYPQELFAEHIKTASRALAEIDDARWWIDRRGPDAGRLLLDMATDNFRRHLFNVLFRD